MSDAPPIIIRPAEPKDAEAIAALTAELAAHEGQISHLTADDVLRDGLADGAAFSVLVAEAQGEVVGFVLYYAGYDLASVTRGTHLSDIVVTKTWRRRGVAKALVAELSRLTLACGGKWIALTVLKDNVPAQQFYRSLKTRTAKVDFMAWGESDLKVLADG